MCIRDYHNLNGEFSQTFLLNERIFHARVKTCDIIERNINITYILNHIHGCGSGIRARG